jgi:predicted dehydrogenase
MVLGDSTTYRNPQLGRLRSVYTKEKTMLRIGLVGIDNGHVVVYSRMLNGAEGSDALGIGAAITHYWQAKDGRWPDHEARFRPQLEALGIRGVDTREEMIGHVDGVIVVGQYNDVNPERARPFIEAKVPTFADKILANELAPAHELAALAERYGTPLISHSALRYVPEVLNFVDRKEELGRFHSGIWIGPGDLMDYGMHTVDPALAVFGPGVEWVYNVHQEDKDMATLTYPDGRIVVVHLRRSGAKEPRWRFACFADKESVEVDVAMQDLYANSLREVLRLFAGQREASPVEEMLETAAVINAMRESGERGERISVPDMLRS